MPRTLPGEHLPPCQQRHLTDEERQRKEAQVFDKACSDIASLWNGRKRDGFDIKVKCTKCMQLPTPYNDHDEVKSLCDFSMRKLSSDNNLLPLREEIRFLLEHCVRKTYQLQFSVCEKPECNHCASVPGHAIKTMGTLKFLG